MKETWKPHTRSGELSSKAPRDDPPDERVVNRDEVANRHEPPLADPATDLDEMPAWPPDDAMGFGTLASRDTERDQATASKSSSDAAALQHKQNLDDLVEHWPTVGYVIACGVPGTVAEDALQAFHLEILNHPQWLTRFLAKVEPDRRRAYLARCLKRYLYRQSQRKREAKVVETLEPNLNLVDLTLSTTRLVVAKDSACRVCSFVHANFPSDGYQAFVLRYLHDRSIEEIADELGIKRGAIRGRLDRIRRRLKDHFGADFGL